MNFLQDRAALYVSGAMTPEQREEFELILEFHPELRELVRFAGGGRYARAHSGAGRSSGAVSGIEVESPARDRDSACPPPTHDALVMTGPDRLVRWVNQEFGAMCGYSLIELQGENLGPILQGEQTDQAAVSRMRAALTEKQPCRETLVNYCKNGSPYLVEIVITPIRDDQDRLRWFIARERLAELSPA